MVEMMDLPEFWLVKRQLLVTDK
jgi:hypothetical protein